MQLCPLCEAPVVAAVCEVCGHCFTAPRTAEAPVSPLLDLDVQLTAAGPTPVSALSDLEPTRFPAAVVAEEWSEVEWERSQMAAAPDIVAGGLADLDTGREVSTSARTPPNVGPVTCRYCRNVQASGLLCERCGLRLPWAQPVSPGPSESGALVRCAQCGARTHAGQRCSSCGMLPAAQL